MVDWSLGTIGFSYPEWKGSFYPSGLPVNQSLSYYSKVFNAVEINTTFYGPQSAEQIRRWAASTPDDFCFCMKAPKRVTHDLRLQEPAASEMRAFVDVSLALEERAGAFLIQLPPSFHADQLPHLAHFLELLVGEQRPRVARYAIEFRHPSWYTQETAQTLVELLRRYDVCWVSADYEDMPMVIHPTAQFLYMRWIAKHNVIAHPGFEVLDRTERLQTWLDLINTVIETTTSSIQQVFGFFDNDYAGHAPQTCARLKKMIGLPVDRSQAGEQGRLF